MKNKILAFAVVLLAGCAGQKPLTTVETVQGAQDSVDKTNEYVVRAENTIKEFEKNLQDLRVESAKSDKMRGKTQFNAALIAMDHKIAESKRDLAQLKQSNTESWDTYKAQLNTAKDGMHTTFENAVE
jgi:hypothetical protein